MQLNEEPSLGLMPEEAIFSLDIGTRTIIGVVGCQKDDCFYVHASEAVTHENRAMLDGQIHDISRVAQGAQKVVRALEQKLGYKISRASIAAAGRVLKTCQVKVEREIDDELEIDTQLISALEMEGIQEAQLKIEKEMSQDEKDSFYCVGYSVVNYFLNDYIISTLEGHKGKKVGVEILATFLPQTVVDSLYTVMERSGLDVDFLTLEPIAAINLVIPQDLRLLNLALVDVGAGTSDIAITKSGTITAYAMVPIAGDELTEAIAQNYLVDFNTAENIKITLSSQETVSFTDILDNEISLTDQEVNAVTRPVIDELARIISKKILDLNNGKPPNAIFLVGGGSQSKGLCEAISAAIGLPADRVAVRNRSIAKNVIIEGDNLKGPENITPLGIFVTTAMTKGQDFFYVNVNGEKIRMYNSRKMTVADALILAGFNPDQLICKSGKSLKFKLNGRGKTVRGSFGKPSEIYVNGKASGLNTGISPGDNINIIPAENGSSGRASAWDLIKDSEPICLTYNDHAETIYPKVFINGIEVPWDTEVQQGDSVEIRGEYTLAEISERYEMDPLVWEFRINGNVCDLKTIIKPGDQVQGAPRTHSAEETSENIGDTMDVPESDNKNGRAAAPPNVLELLKEAEHKLAARDGITVTVNGAPVNLPPKNSDYLFIDVFNYIDFDLTTPKGVIMLRLNGKDANYTDVIKTGDIIDIYWRE